jgi:hypothetical protein
MTCVNFKGRRALISLNSEHPSATEDHLSSNCAQSSDDKNTYAGLYIVRDTGQSGL